MGTINVSVVMSVYNEPKEYVTESIDSILNQTYKDFEFIIVYDNPTKDDLLGLLVSFTKKDNRIVLIRNDENIGLTKSLNKAIRASKGQFIARMDADDISENNRFEEQVFFLQNNPNVGVCGSQINYIDEKGQIIGQNLFPEHKEDFPYMIMPFFSHPAVMIRKCCLLQLPQPYDEDFKYAQDFNLWYKLDNICCFYNIPLKLLNYRKSSNQIGTKKNKEQKYFSEKIQLNYLRRFNPELDINWKQLDYKEISKIRNILESCSISSQAVNMGCFSLYKRINKRKIVSLFYLIIHKKQLSLNLYELFVIFKNILKN